MGARISTSSRGSPRSGHAGVLEGPNRPSADFFHTRASKCASPRAWVNSATSASSCCSRFDGPDLPAISPARPDSRSCRFQFPTDCSDTVARRAASATLTPPAMTDNTIRTFSSADSAAGLAMNDQTPSTGHTRKKRVLPQSLTRDNNNVGPVSSTRLKPGFVGGRPFDKNASLPSRPRSDSANVHV
jgi:hypothetical protein